MQEVLYTESHVCVYPNLPTHPTPFSHVVSITFVLSCVSVSESLNLRPLEF